MEQSKKISRKVISVVLSLLMVFSGMGLTAYAAGEKAYVAYDVTTETNKTKSGGDLTALQVTFKGKKWYIIKDNSSSATSGTVTLLSADTTFGTKRFDNGDYSNKYSTSQVKAYLDSMTGTNGAFADVADAIETVNLTTNKYKSTEEYETVNGVKLYLLSTEDANSLPTNVRKAGFSGVDIEYNEWWLRSPGSNDGVAASVYGTNGNVAGNGLDVYYALGVRPALKLDLSKVTFDSDTNTFTMGSAASTTYIDGSGESQTVNATELAASTTSWTNGSWYIVPAGGVTISSRITVNGTVNLILRDGATLTASAGITTTNATLNIYAQSAGTGALTAKGSTGCAGIGGRVGGYGSNGGAGGTVSIFGGTVTATGGTAANCDGAGAGIGGGGAGLGMGDTGGAGGTVSIFGGTVTATGGAANSGGGAGAGIGGGGKDMRGSAGASGALTLGKGVKLYSGTNNSGTVLDGSDSTERSYSGSRPQKMFAELYTGPNKTDLNTAITAAETLYNSIKDDTNYSTIASTLKTAIDASKAVADSETADQDAVDTAKTAITTAKTNAEAAKKDVDDTNAANPVITIINALPAADDVTTANKEAIEAARAAYNALTDDQKKKVDATVLAKLTDAETALQDAVDTETAQGATDTINALPDADKVTTADKDAIEAARKAYNDLTDDQKKKVSDDTLKKLTDAEDALKAAGVSDTINALPEADEVTTADKDAIEKARKAYDALTDEQKAYVAPETLKKLTDAESALAVAEANKAISELPKADKVTTADKNAIEAARKAYDALTDEEKAQIAPETLKKLTDAEDALAAATVSNEINALPAAAEVTTDNKAAIEAARKAYDALTDEEKAQIAPETLKKLTDAESALAVAEANKAISELPDADKVTLADKDAIEAARKAYDALTDEEKAQIAPETLKKLANAESALAVVEVNEAINALPASGKVTTADKAAIKAARAAYDALTAEQKAKISADTLKKLTDAEAALAAAENATSPQTGDNIHMGLWIALMMFSLLGIAATLLYGRKKRVFDR